MRIEIRSRILYIQVDNFRVVFLNGVFVQHVGQWGLFCGFEMQQASSLSTELWLALLISEAYHHQYKPGYCGVKIKCSNIPSVSDVVPLCSEACDNQNTSLKQSLLSRCVYRLSAWYYFNHFA